MIRRPPRSTLSSASAASDVYKRQVDAVSSARSARRSKTPRRVMELHACYFKDLGAFSTDQRRASATAGKTGTRATGQRNWPTHPAVPPGTDDQNSTPARELEPPQPLLRSLDGGQHPCAKSALALRHVSPAGHATARH